ncbi:MAG TPA: ATP-binding protein [Gemmatimonadaceae bacterium]
MGLYALVGGVVSFVAWPADLPRLADWFNNGISIQPNTGVAVACSGAALLMIAAGRTLLVPLLGVVVTAIGVTALMQHLLHAPFTPLNTLLMFDRPWGASSTISRGLMGPPGSLCWTLTGGVLVMQPLLRPGKRRMLPRLAVFMFIVAMLSMVGYFYDADRLFSMPRLTAVALQTATFIAAVAAGLVASVPEHAPTRWFLHPGATGAVARRAVPLILTLPFLAGWIRLWGERAGAYDTSFGVAILVVVVVILMLALLSWTLRTIAEHEAALRESQQSVMATLESIADGFVTLDRDWRYRYVNAEAARLLGKTPADLIGRSIWDLFPETVESTAYRALHRVADTRTRVEFEDYNPALERWFANRAYPGSDGAVSVHFHDVTPRKLAERERAAELEAMSRLQRLSTRLVQSGDLHSLLGEILSAAAELTGTTKGDIQFIDTESNTLRILVHQGLGERFLDRFMLSGAPNGCDLAARQKQRLAISDISADKTWQGTNDLEILLADGIRAFQSTPLVSRDGRLLGVLSTHFTAPHALSEREARYLDLLARMAADFIERSQSEDAARRADRMKDEFLAMLAHELRNPLAPIQNAVQLLRSSGGRDETVRFTADVLNRQVGQLVRLVNDLVDVSRITRGKIELVRTTVDLAAVIRQAVEAVRPMIDSKEQVLELALPSAPLRLTGDFTRLTQVIGNVLSNATKFTGEGGRISVTVTRQDSQYEIAVRDNGIGIAAEQLPNVFELFVQGDTSLERSVSGLGIGLMLVKTLVTMHGGTVDVRSDGVGTGTEVRITLPEGVPSAPAEQAAPAVATATFSEPRRVLIVDDNRDGALSLAQVLSLSGHITWTAHDGEEGVAMAEELHPDVVLLDIGLPKLNGYEACRRIRSQPWGKRMKLVAVTGWGAETYRLRSTDAGFDTHLVKPVDSAALINLLHRD